MDQHQTPPDGQQASHGTVGSHFAVKLSCADFAALRGAAAAASLFELPGVPPLARAWLCGAVRQGSGSSLPGSFHLDDGSGAPVRVTCKGLEEAATLRAGDFVMAIGGVRPAKKDAMTLRAHKVRGCAGWPLDPQQQHQAQPSRGFLQSGATRSAGVCSSSHARRSSARIMGVIGCVSGTQSWPSCAGRCTQVGVAHGGGGGGLPLGGGGGRRGQECGAFVGM